MEGRMWEEVWNVRSEHEIVNNECEGKMGIVKN
jgi:hypothetical protein